jgi:hypothetical protein
MEYWRTFEENRSDMKTTLELIRKQKPCEESWSELLKSLNKTKADSEPLELTYILETLGIEDAIWSLRSLEGKDKEIRLFAADCAESVLHIFEKEHPNDDRPRKAILAARDYANGFITSQELKAAGAAAGAAAGDAARATARDAAFAAAADAAWAVDGAAAGATARDAEKEKQKEIFIKYFGQ